MRKLKEQMTALAKKSSLKPKAQFLTLARIGGNRCSDRTMIASCVETPEGAYVILITKKIRNADVRGETEKTFDGKNLVVVTKCDDVFEGEGASKTWRAHRVTAEVRQLGRVVRKDITLHFQTEEGG